MRQFTEAREGLIMTKYAENTSVSIEKSKAEIEQTLTRYGAGQFVSGTDLDKGEAMIMFRMRDRNFRFNISMPLQTDNAFTLTETGRTRVKEAALKAWERAGRQKWRALALVIKAKLEAVESGISTVEDEFLAWTMLPDGTTVSQSAQEALAVAYESGQMQTLIPILEKKNGS